MPEVDLDKVDASWDDDEPEPSGPVDGSAAGGTSRTPDVDGSAAGGTSRTPDVDGSAAGGTSRTPEIDALDAGWDTPRGRKNAADKAAARKDKARARKERQRARAEEAAQKQKKKLKKPRPSRHVEGAPRATPVPGELSEGDSPRPLSRRKRAARHGWGLTLIAVAIIIAVAAFVLFVVRR